MGLPSCPRFVPAPPAAPASPCRNEPRRTAKQSAAVRPSSPPVIQDSHSSTAAYPAILGSTDRARKQESARRSPPASECSSAAAVPVAPQSPSRSSPGVPSPTDDPVLYDSARNPASTSCRGLQAAAAHAPEPHRRQTPGSHSSHAPQTPNW